MKRLFFLIGFLFSANLFAPQQSLFEMTPRTSKDIKKDLKFEAKILPIEIKKLKLIDNAEELIKFNMEGINYYSLNKKKDDVIVDIELYKNLISFKKKMELLICFVNLNAKHSNGLRSNCEASFFLNKALLKIKSFLRPNVTNIRTYANRNNEFVEVICFALSVLRGLINEQVIAGKAKLSAFLRINLNNSNLNEPSLLTSNNLCNEKFLDQVLCFSGEELEEEIFKKRRYQGNA